MESGADPQMFRCKGCRFWGSNAGISAQAHISECVRHAPRAPAPNAKYISPVWPMTLPQHWCGDGEPGVF